MKPAIIIDIETRPDPDLSVDEEYLEALRASIPDNRAVKDAFLQEAKRDEKIVQHIERMALQATTGAVVAIGVASLSQDDQVVLHNMTHEAFLLADFQRFLDEVPGKPVVAGFNVREFDIPFLTARCAINGIDLPDWWPFIRDWHNVADIMDVLGKSGKLAEWARAFRLPPPTVSGEAVTKLSEEDLVKHCDEDLTVTKAMMRKLARRFPCLRSPKKGAFR